MVAKTHKRTMYSTAQLQGNEHLRVSHGLHASDTRVTSE